jgi:hypothetical protein
MHHGPGEVKALVGMSFLDDDGDGEGENRKDDFMDAHGLLLELEEELTTIMNKDMTHVSIGFAVNREQVKVVELFSQKPLMIEKLEASADQGVSMRGMMLSSTVGLYAARIILEKAIHEGKKDIKTVGPYAIQFDKTSKRFQINMEGPLDVFNKRDTEDPRYIEVYVREKQIDKIEYGGSIERVDVKHLKCVYRIPCDYFPDPRAQIEDERDEQHRENAMKQREEEDA